MAPKPVSPVVADGVQYSAEGDGRDQYVVAEDAASGKVLWKVKVFHNHIKPWLEEDVQWVYITDLRVAGKTLLVRDERPRCYTLDLTNKQVKTHDCGNLFGE